MVTFRSLQSFRGFIGLLLLTLSAPTLWAQNYSPTDTVTEYPLKGTYYHNKFEGRKTSSGEIFDQNLFTAAHWKIKLGTYVLVTNCNTGLQVIVKVNDRCPRKGVFDMTRRAAHSIGIKGCQPVTVRLLEGDYSELCASQDLKFDSVPSRYASGELALKAVPDTKPNPSTTRKTKEEKQMPKLPSPSMQSDRYNLVLGTVKNYGQAFELTKKLPDPYQDKTIIDSIAEGVITVSLDVRLSKKNAQELTRALRHTYKECKIAPVE